jgi:hypothetical protein
MDAPGSDAKFPGREAPSLHATGRRGRDSSRETDDLDDLDDDEPRRRRNASYSILQYVILMAVAFVLGLLVWELISRGSDSQGALPNPGAFAGHVAVIRQYVGL